MTDRQPVTHQSADSAGIARSNRTPHSIRFQLLVAVNTAMAMVFAVFLMIDYRREWTARLAERQLHLEEEAKTLATAVVELQHRGWDSVQSLIDTVCGRMQESDSPGHHIALESGEVTLQAHAHHRASSEMLVAMRAAASSPRHRAKVEGTEIVVGDHRDANLTVYVSEFDANLRRAVLGEVLRRVAGIVLLGILAGVVANLVLLRLVVRPLDQLVATVRTITAGQLGAQTESLNSAELTYLGNAINMMSSSLAEADRERHSQMAKARAIQQHLLPLEVQIPGLTLAHLYRPATEVAGDYYDAIKLPDDTWLLCIADVTGHGVPAAMEAAILKAVLLHAAEHHTQPDDILAFMDDRFTAVSLPDDFASVLLARWYPTRSMFEYASAGHEPAWFLTARSEPRELDSTGPLLGVLPDSAWTTERLSVATGDRLLLITDGVTEAMNSDNTPFGRDRLAQLLRDSRNISATELLQRIDEQIAAHRGHLPPSDDLTIVLLEFSPNGF